MSKTLRRAVLEVFQETVHERSVMARVATAQCFDNGAESKHGPAQEDDVTRQLKHLVCNNPSLNAKEIARDAEERQNDGFLNVEIDNGSHHDLTTEFREAWNKAHGNVVHPMTEAKQITIQVSKGLKIRRKSA